jgi:hypothetical protein
MAARLVAALALAVIGGSGSARGYILVQDSFNYPNGCVTAVSGGLWAAHSQPGVGCVTVSGGQLQVSFWNAEDVSVALPGAPYDTVNNPGIDALYSSFTLTCIELPTTPYGAYFAHFMDSGTFFRDRVWAMTNGAAPGMYRLAIGSTNSSGAGATVFPMDLAPNMAYTIVTRLILPTGASALGINPATESDLIAISPQPDPGQPFATSRYGFRQVRRERGVMLVDNFKVSTSFSDLVGISTPPLISAFVGQSTPMNVPKGPIPFMVQSAHAAAGSLLVSALSSNSAIVPNDTAHLMLSGVGSNRFLTIVPGTNVQGTAMINLSVSDGTASTRTAFLLTVGAPTISPIPDQVTFSNTPLLNIPFTAVDPDGDQLVLGVSASNPGLFPAGSIGLGGTGSNRTVSLYPAPNQTGIAAVTISVTDGHNTNSTMFSVAVSPRLGLLLSEPFPYPDGQSLALPGTPWSTSSGTPMQIKVANHNAMLAYSNTECAAITIPGGPYQPSNAVTLYASFTVNFAVLPFSNGNYCCTFKGTDDLTSRSKFWARTLNAHPGYLRVGIANFEDTPVDFPMDLSLNSMHQIVIAYATGLNKSALWVDALSEQSPQVVASDMPSPAPISRFVLREAKGMGKPGIGNLKLGTSFQDAFTPPPPEALSIQRSGTNVVLSWNNSLFKLAARTNLSGVDTRIPGGSPSTNPITRGQQFFRLVYP